MHSKVTKITEENDVSVGAFAVHADAADGVVVDGSAVVFAVGLDVEVRFFFESENQILANVNFGDSKCA